MAGAAINLFFYMPASHVILHFFCFKPLLLYTHSHELLYIVVHFVKNLELISSISSDGLFVPLLFLCDFVIIESICVLGSWSLLVLCWEKLHNSLSSRYMRGV